MLAGLINCRNKTEKEEMINLVSILYSEISDKYKIEDVYDKIYKFFDDKLDLIDVDNINEIISLKKIELLVKDYFKNINNEDNIKEVSDEIKNMNKNLKEIKTLMKKLKIVVPDSDC